MSENEKAFIPMSSSQGGSCIISLANFVLNGWKCREVGSNGEKKIWKFRDRNGETKNLKKVIYWSSGIDVIKWQSKKMIEWIMVIGICYNYQENVFNDEYSNKQFTMFVKCLHCHAKKTFNFIFCETYTTIWFVFYNKFSDTSLFFGISDICPQWLVTDGYGVSDWNR